MTSRPMTKGRRKRSVHTWKNFLHQSFYNRSGGVARVTGCPRNYLRPSTCGNHSTLHSSCAIFPIVVFLSTRLTWSMNRSNRSNSINGSNILEHTHTHKSVKRRISSRDTFFIAQLIIYSDVNSQSVIFESYLSYLQPGDANISVMHRNDSAGQYLFCIYFCWHYVS